ncbi:hypothetical protein MRX96_023097 [Rhipicephalus microplus]
MFKRHRHGLATRSHPEVSETPHQVSSHSITHLRRLGSLSRGASQSTFVAPSPQQVFRHFHVPTIPDHHGGPYGDLSLGRTRLKITLVATSLDEGRHVTLRTPCSRHISGRLGGCRDAGK